MLMIGRLRPDGDHPSGSPPRSQKANDMNEQHLLKTAGISERQIQAVWYDGTLRPANLLTYSGEPLHVVDPGVWNLEAGPDFKNAVVEIGITHRRIVGDVEIHIHPSDWTSHGHSSDPAYSNVAVHATWLPGSPPAGLPPNCTSVCLGSFAELMHDFDLSRIDVGAYPFAFIPNDPRPCEESLHDAPDATLAVLRSAGRLRLMRKAHRLSELINRRSTSSQLFYEEVFAALGYKYNAFPFRDIAAEMPWNELPPDAEFAETVLSCIAKMRVHDAKPWRRANVRPANSPERRLKAAAALFCQGPALYGRLTSCDLSERKGQNSAAAILCESKLLGRRRAGAIMANVLIPFAIATRRMSNVPEWILPEDVSAPVRLAAFRLLGRDHNPAVYSGNGLLIQGLLHIHREFCLAVHPDCRVCALAKAAHDLSERVLTRGKGV